MIIYVERRRRYGILHFLFDMFMVFITGGLWIFVMLYSFLRNH